MGIIDRYIWRRYLTRLLAGLAAFIGVYLLVDMFGHLSDFARAGWSFDQTLRYMMLITPSAALLVLPTACLVATASLLGAMWQSNELPAVLGAGRSWARAVVPMLVVAGLVSLAAAALSEWAVPPTLKEATRMRAAADNGAEDEAAAGPVLLALTDGTIFHVGELEDSEGRAGDVIIWQAGRSGETYIWAKQAAFEDGAWTLYSGVLRRSGEGAVRREPFDVRRTDITVPPKELRAGGTPPSAMSFSELRRYISSIPGNPPPEMAVELYLKSALPFASLVLAIVGCALALRRPARGELAAFGSSLAVALVYFLFLAGAKEMWRTAIPPLALAWAPNVLFAAVGLFALRRTSGLN